MWWSSVKFGGSVAFGAVLLDRAGVAEPISVILHRLPPWPSGINILCALSGQVDAPRRTSTAPPSLTDP